MTRPDRPPVLLALTPLAERAVEALLFGADAPIELIGSAAEADELDRLSTETEAEAALVSPQLAGLTPGHCARVRSKGIRVIGLALGEHERQQLDALGAEHTIDTEATPDLLAAAIRRPLAADPQPSDGPRPRRNEDREHHAVVGVLGSKGAPGASELAASLAALVGDTWPALLVELDAMGGDLDLRLAADADDGSVLGLVRAVQNGHGHDDDLRGLLERWIVGAPGWPAVLLGAPSGNGHLALLDQPGAVAKALDTVACLWPAVVCDLGFVLDDSDAAASRVHREALVNADAVVLVVGAREAQLRHGIAQLDTLLDELAIPRERVRVVVNGIDAPGAPDRRTVEQTILAALADRRLTADAWLPWDGRGLRRAQRLGVPIAQAHPRGGYARVLRSLLDDLFLPTPEPQPRERKHALSASPAARRPDAREEVALPWRSTS
jgi:hypothetical protein